MTINLGESTSKGKFADEAKKLFIDRRLFHHVLRGIRSRFVMFGKHVFT